MKTEKQIRTMRRTALHEVETASGTLSVMEHKQIVYDLLGEILDYDEPEQTESTETPIEN